MAERRAGVLFHPTSLPSHKLDKQAWYFLDWLEKAELSVWQMLPLSEPVQGLSPYQSVSAFAMNPALLPDDWQNQFDEGAYKQYLKDVPHWLEEYALFMALRKAHEYKTWSQWPAPFRNCDADALAQFEKRHYTEIELLKKQQFMLHHIWSSLKAAANEKGIALFGDMPIFVAYDSADVWANPHLFKLGKDLLPEVVAGVPPDYFSETGQRWGNPHYDWPEMRKDKFAWWTQRVSEALKQFDMIRIDHFRGLEACWEIPADEPTAINGKWVKVPGEGFLTHLKEFFPNLPLIAEDLGLITPEVVALKEQFNLPGMSVLQFGFNGLPDNPHSLDEQVENSVVYTGTHDNDTSLGWWLSLEDPNFKYWVMSRLHGNENDMPWPLIEAALASVAGLAIVPMQDFLALDSNHRMNVPGTVDGNWTWSIKGEQVTSELAKKIATLVEKTARVVSWE